MQLLNGDCMKLMKEIPDGSVDLILCDLPYGTTDCEWDSILPFDQLWREYNRVLKVNGVAALFAAQPFTTQLISSNRRDFRYCWYWLKNQATGFTFARYQPLRQIEEIVVFICNTPGRNNAGKHLVLREYMFNELHRSGKSRTDINKILGNYMSSHYFTNGQQFMIPTAECWAKLQAATGCFDRSYEDIRKEYESELGGSSGESFTYNPQGLQIIKNPKPKRRRGTLREAVYSMDTLMQEYTPHYKNYPKNVLQFNTERGLHPTQKPVPMLEYLVRTYTNELYDYMHLAGLTIHQMRICQPYGDDQRRGLWLFHLIEPETWARVVARVNGANSGAMYINESGNVNGYRKITKPKGHTWKSFATLLINSMPPKTQEHYKNKIYKFVKWWEERGYPDGIPDEADYQLEQKKDVPSWRRICKSLLRNDYWCKGLSFTQQKSTAYERYIEMVKRQREKDDSQIGLFDA